MFEHAEGSLAAKEPSACSNMLGYNDHSVSTSRTGFFIRPMAPSQSASRKAFVCLSSVICCLSSVSKTADIMIISVSFRYGKWVVPLIL